MNAEETPESHEPEATAGVRRVGCKHVLDRLFPVSNPIIPRRPGKWVAPLIAGFSPTGLSRSDRLLE